MADDLEGCGDHSCVIAKPGGMGTNGGCRCERVHLRRAVHVLRERLRAVEAERDLARLRAIEEAATEALLRLAPSFAMMDPVVFKAVTDLRAALAARSETKERA